MDEKLELAQVQTQEPEEDEVDDRPVIGKCYVCDAEIREGDYFEEDCEGNKYCEDCEGERGWCEHCKQDVPPDSTRAVRVGYRNEEYWCEHCRDNDAVECDDCGEMVSTNYTHSDDRSVVCDDCYDDHWVTCCDCDCLVRTEDSLCDERTYEYYCEGCWDERKKYENIHEYEYKPRPVFFGDGKAAEHLYLGFELEAGCLDNDYDADEIAGEVSDGHCYCKHDCSIDEYGFELVSHPHTLQAHKEAGWDKTLKIMRDSGMLSHDAKNCGLHVHASRMFMGDDEEEKWDLVADFMSKHKDKFVKLARRESSYAYYVCDGEGRRGRYCALNLTNSSTVEFRIFKGTLKFETLMASLELVDATCRFVKAWGRDDIVPGWYDFCIYISNHRADYGELIDYMDAKYVWSFAGHKAPSYDAADEC